MFELGQLRISSSRPVGHCELSLLKSRNENFHGRQMEFAQRYAGLLAGEQGLCPLDQLHMLLDCGELYLVVLWTRHGWEVRGHGPYWESIAIPWQSLVAHPDRFAPRAWRLATIQPREAIVGPIARP